MRARARVEVQVGVNKEPQMDSLWALDILFNFVGRVEDNRDGFLGFCNNGLCRG